MAEGNGGDVGAVYALLNVVAEEMRSGFRRVDAEIRGLRGEMQAGFRRVDGEIAGLREAVTHYHSSVLGHGVLISELDDRVRRIERHLALPPAG